MVIATGAEYRRLPIANLGEFEGAGVYYGATSIEAQLCGGEEVIVVGGGNSAGQAAVFLAQTARRVHMVVRSAGLAETMSRYLIRRIEESPNIELAHADRNRGPRRRRPPRTGPLARSRRRPGRDARHPSRLRDDRRHAQHRTGSTAASRSTASGFIKTGPDLSADDLPAAKWPLQAPAAPARDQLPGVFAVGDVRGGNVKRVASAVGEGSIAISFVHRVLQE